MLLSSDQMSRGDLRELELLIREARRRQRRRRLTATLLLVAGLGGAYLTTHSGSSVRRSGSLLSRTVHVGSLQPGARCPTATGYPIDNGYFAGTALGRGPVGVLLADKGDVAHGRVDIPATNNGSWHALQTLWFATPRYDGPFVVRAADLAAHGPIEVQPGATGTIPGSGALLVPAGPTINTQDGYRTVPGSTWIKTPGCYAWQVDGRGFSEIITINVTTTHR